MSGTQNFQGAMFGYICLDDRVPAKKPLRKLRAVVDGMLATITAEFESVCSRNVRPSVLPEVLLKACRKLGITPHVAAKAQHSAIDGCTQRHEVYKTSPRVRRRIEEAFGWIKTVDGLAKTS